MVIFDVDGTLIGIEDQPRWPVIDLLRAFRAVGVPVGVWSGGGADYAGNWCRRLGIEEFVSWVGAKGDIPPLNPILYVDDQPEADFGVAPVMLV